MIRIMPAGRRALVLLRAAALFMAMPLDTLSWGRRAGVSIFANARGFIALASQFL